MPDEKQDINKYLEHWKWLIDKPTIVTRTYAEAKALNRLCKERSLETLPHEILMEEQHSEVPKKRLCSPEEAQRLAERCLEVKGEVFHRGDRVIFRAQSEFYPIRHADCGTIRSIQAGTITLRLDNDSRVTVDPEYFHQFEPAFALSLKDLTSLKEPPTHGQIAVYGNLPEVAIDYLRARYQVTILDGSAVSREAEKFARFVAERKVWLQQSVREERIYKLGCKGLERTDRERNQDLGL